MAPGGAVHESETWLLLGVAVTAGADGGTHEGVTGTSGELAELQKPLLAART